MNKILYLDGKVFLTKIIKGKFKMKRFITLALVALMSLTLFAGCGKFECDSCGEKKGGKKHEAEIFGEELVLCDDCYEDINELGGDLF